MKILIAGLGSIGRRHLNNLVSLGEQDIVLYRTNQSTLPDSELDRFPVETDISKALSRNPDAVVIANPTSMHMEIAKAAAEANVHIFLEKPISHTIDSLLPFEAILKNSRSKVFTAYQFRFNPGLIKIKEFIENGKIGKPISFNCSWSEYLPDWHPWEDYRISYAARKRLGGGVVLTLSHPIDYLRWIFGDVKELFARTGKLSDLEVDVEDSADVLLTYRNGTVGTLHLDYYSRPKKHRLTIICSEGTIGWKYLDSSIRVEKMNGEVLEFPASDSYDRNQMYLDEMQHFLDICNKDIQPICSYSDGKKALEICWGILQSGKYKERVIFDE